LRHGLRRQPLPGARRVAKPGLRGSAGDGHRLPRGQRLRLHHGEPRHRPGQDRRARGVLPEARGYYYENWDELYEKFKEKMRALIAEITDLHVPELPEYEADEVAFEDDRNTSFYEVLAA